MAVHPATQRFRALSERLGHIRDSIDAAASRPESLTDGARVALRVVTEVFELTIDTLRKRWDNLERVSESRRDELKLDLCNDLQDVVRELGTSLLPLLTAARFEAVPVELEPVLARYAQEAAPGWAVHCVVIGSPEYNYSIQYLQDPVAKWADALGADVETGPSESSSRESALLLLSIPRTERRAATLHSVLLGHEIGHLFDWYHGISSGYPIPKIDEIIPAEPPSFDDYFRYELFVAVARNWLREIVADFYGTLTLGPASILALMELVGGLAPLDLDSLTHPGTDRRAALVAEVLEKLGYDFSSRSFRFLSDLRDAVDSAAERPIDLPVEIKERMPDGAKTVDDAWRWAHSVREDLWHMVSKASRSENRTDPASWKKIEDLSVALRQGRSAGERLLPGGRGAEACGPSEMLNAGWLVKLEGLESLAAILRADPNEWDELARVANVLDELVLKSIEISEYRRYSPWQ